MIFNERLKETRTEKGFTQKTFAVALDVSVSCYAGYEQGYREPDLKMLIKICRLLSVDSDYLLGLKDD